MPGGSAWGSSAAVPITATSKAVVREAIFIRQGKYEKPWQHTMFCSLALAVPDTVVWRFEIAFMATLFEIEGNLKYELVDKIADGRMRGCFGPIDRAAS